MLYILSLHTNNGLNKPIIIAIAIKFQKVIEIVW